MRPFNPPKYVGKFRPSKIFCSDKSTSIESLGTFTLTLPNGKQVPINELHYRLKTGELGLNIIPVVDRKADAGSPEYDEYPQAALINGAEVIGCEYFDALLRTEYQADLSTPAVAILSYQHFENGKGELKDLAAPNSLKAEHSQTHSALYLGQGKTRNSPFNYHGNRLKVTAYPANVYIIKPRGIDINTFLLNWDIASRLINEAGGGVVFPNDYKFDNYHLTSLQQVLEHYRGWIDRTWVNPRVSNTVPFHEILRGKNVFALYCGEFTSFALNLALNLPFNEQGFFKVFGAAEGEALWETTRETWRTLTGNEIPKVPDFSPFWEQDGETKPLFKDVLGMHLAFKPQNTADLVSCFMQQYAPWPVVGVGTSAAICLGFLPEVRNRSGLADAQLIPLFLKVIGLMALYESITRTTPVESIIQDIIQGIRALGAGDVVMMEAYLKRALTSDEARSKREILIAGGLASQERAYGLYLAEVAKLRLEVDKISTENDLEEQITAEISGQSIATNVQFYSPPAVFHRIATGLYPCDPRIEVQAVGTIMDVSDVDDVSTQTAPSVQQSTATQGGRK